MNYAPTITPGTNVDNVGCPAGLFYFDTINESIVSEELTTVINRFLYGEIRVDPTNPNVETDFIIPIPEGATLNVAYGGGSSYEGVQLLSMKMTDQVFLW